MTDMDFDALNRELEESARRRKADFPPPMQFDRFFAARYPSTDMLARCIDDARSAKDIDYYFDLDGTGAKLLAKRLIRKANRFLFFRNTESQRSFNADMLQASRLLYKSLLQMQEQHEQDRQRISVLEERLRALEAQR